MPDDDETTDTTEPAPADASAEPVAATSGLGRGWKIAAVVSVLAAAVAVGVLGSLLLSGGSDSDVDSDVRACVPSRDFTKESTDKGDECPPKGAKQLDGLVEKTSDGGFTMRVIDGGRLGDTVELFVRTPDRAYIDIAHAQTHAALGQPVRVYLEEIEGRTSVVYMEDAPLLR